MRVIQNAQMQMGEVDISRIRFDPKSRDDIPRMLRGLQYIYTTLSLREKVFALLEEKIAPKINKRNGRPGMTLWRILVCGLVRIDLNGDYDRLHELVNHHDTLRQMLGHGSFDETCYHYQTLQDNVGLLTPELIDEINQLVVSEGHVLVKKKADATLRGRCDSFVVETNVHYPTDITLLWDAMRKVITLTARLCERVACTSWRQHAYNLRHLKRLLRAAQSKKRRKTADPHQSAMIKAHQELINVAGAYLDRARATLRGLERQGGLDLCDILLMQQIDYFMKHAVRQIDQTRRRVLLGETIPHHEKVFSIFEPHTEWIVKGKAGVPVELGLKVCVMEDQYQFLLHHQVMQQQTDDQVAVSMVEQTKKRFPHFIACSFDRGFHSPRNQVALKERLEHVALPRKGKLSKIAQEIEHSEEFITTHRKHSAVESAINALEVHGLDRCPDRGIHAFKRYVALAILARNIHRIGDLLAQQEKKRLLRKQKHLERHRLLKLAA